jgi:hypothetical protein
MKQLTFRLRNGYWQSMDGERKRDGGTSRDALHGVRGGGEMEEPPTIASQKLKSPLFLCEEHPQLMVQSCDEIMHFLGEMEGESKSQTSIKEGERP